MWMESDRIFHPVFREFYAERDVVFEERRMRTDSTPLGKFSEEFNAMFWESSPYSWPVVGWPSDIPAISKAQADEFYQTYYAPQNIALILVGDFKLEQAETLAKKYFERIPRPGNDPLAVADAVFFLVDNVVVFDHLLHLDAGCLWIIHRNSAEHHLLGAIDLASRAGGAVGIGQVAGHGIEPLRLRAHGRTRHIENIKQRHDYCPP